MKISDQLSSTDVTADLVVVDKQQLLHELARRAGAVVDVLPDRISAELIPWLAREFPSYTSDGFRGAEKSLHQPLSW